MFNWFKNLFSNFKFDPFATEARNETQRHYQEIMEQDIYDGFQKDKEALASDWRAIGVDFRKVIKKSK